MAAKQRATPASH